MTSLTGPLFTQGTAAVAAASGFVAVALFQVALAAGAPFGRAAWGGTHPGQLPAGLRVGSAVAVGVWLLAAAIVGGRAGVLASPFSPVFLQRGTWVLVAVTLLGAVMNLVSPSPWERFMWAPVTLALAGLCLMVARGGSTV
jgi:hypothetical protein